MTRPGTVHKQEISTYIQKVEEHCFAFIPAGRGILEDDPVHGQQLAFARRLAAGAIERSLAMRKALHLTKHASAAIWVHWRMR